MCQTSPTPSTCLPVLPALDQVGVFAQDSFQLPLARLLLLLQIHAVPQHSCPTASRYSRAAEGAGAGAVRPGPPTGLPRRWAPAEVRGGRVCFVGPGMRTAERLVHPGDGTVHSRRRRRSRKRGEEGRGMDQKQQQKRFLAKHKC